MKFPPLRRTATLIAVVCTTLCAPPLAGCTAVSYGLGVATMVNDMNARQREEYQSYRRRAEAANESRVMTFRQWQRSGQGG